MLGNGPDRSGTDTRPHAWSRRKRRLFRWLFALVVLASLVILFMPPSGVPSSPPGTDKVVHVGLFAALFITGIAARIPWRALTPALVAYAGVSEIIQVTLGRSADLTDAIADVGGILLGALVAAAGMRRRR